MSNKRKNVFMALNHIEKSLILYSSITKYVSNSALLRLLLYAKSIIK